MPELGSGISSPAMKSLGIGSLPDLGVQFQDASKRFTEATDKVGAASKEREAALVPIEQKISATQGAAPQAPKYDAIPDKFEHRGMTNEQMNDAMGTMLAFAALGGLMTRAPMTTAMTSLAAGLQGLVKGDNELFLRESKTFDHNMKQAIAKNNQAAQEYREAWDKHKLDLTTLQSEWNMISKKYGDTVAAANIEAKNASDIMKHVENLARMGDQAERTRKMFEVQSSRVAEQHRANVEREKIARERNAVALQKIEAAKKKGGELNLKGKQLDSYIHNTSNIEAIDDILTELESNPDAVGFKTMIPGIVLNRADPEGTPVRASIANITSMTIKDRAGTAQTVSEMKNIAPFVPRPGDDVDTVITKLARMKREMQRMNDTAVSVSSGGGVGKTSIPPVNANGWKLHEDAQGNKAYVGPNNEIEEVQ